MELPKRPYSICFNSSCLPTSLPISFSSSATRAFSFCGCPPTNHGRLLRWGSSDRGAAAHLEELFDKFGCAVLIGVNEGFPDGDPARQGAAGVPSERGGGYGSDSRPFGAGGDRGARSSTAQQATMSASAAAWGGTRQRFGALDVALVVAGERDFVCCVRHVLVALLRGGPVSGLLLE